MPVFCTRCGHQNPDDARFCSSCGAAQTPVGSRLPAEADDHPRAARTTSTTSAAPAATGASATGPASTDTTSTDTTSTVSLGALESALDGDGGTEEAPDAEGVPLPPGSALLVVKRGPNAGSRFLLDSTVTTAGRHPDSDIFLDDVTVSRRHAEFLRDGNSFSVRDVGSLNGTYLNRERIDATALSGGDEVQVGKFRLVFLSGARSGGEAAAAPAPQAR